MEIQLVYKVIKRRDVICGRAAAISIKKYKNHKYNVKNRKIGKWR